MTLVEGETGFFLSPRAKEPVTACWYESDSGIANIKKTPLYIQHMTNYMQSYKSAV